MAKRSLLLLMLFAVSAVVAAVLPWDKAPEQWSLADVFRILQNSPWSPSKFSLESNYRQRRTNPQSGVVDDSPVNGKNSAVAVVPSAKPARLGLAELKEAARARREGVGKPQDDARNRGSAPVLSEKVGE